MQVRNPSTYRAPDDPYCQAPLQNYAEETNQQWNVLLLHRGKTSGDDMRTRETASWLFIPAPLTQACRWLATEQITSE